MSKAIENLVTAQQYAMKIRPKDGGFPYLAEVLRTAGIIRNIWTLPSCQSLFLTEKGPVVIQGTPLVTGAVDVPGFNCDALIRALRIDQAGESTFSQFLESSWQAGVIRYEVDFSKRIVTYYGCLDEKYSEEYATIELTHMKN